MKRLGVTGGTCVGEGIRVRAWGGEWIYGIIGGEETEGRVQAGRGGGSQLTLTLTGRGLSEQGIGGFLVMIARRITA